MGLLTKPRTSPPADIPQPAEDEQELRRQLAETQAALRAVDDQIRAAEYERDAAIELLRAIESRAGNSIEMWRAEEQRDSANALISRLTEERKPLSVRYGRLNGYLAPIDRERERLESLQGALQAWEKLAEAFPLMDQICEVVAAAKELGRSNPDFSVPPSLEQFARTMVATSWTRTRIDYSIRSTVDGHRQTIANLRAGGAR